MANISGGRHQQHRHDWKGTEEETYYLSYKLLQDAYSSHLQEN